VVARLKLPDTARPMGLALTADGATLYVSNGRAGTVSRVDLATGTVTGTVTAGTRPWGIGLSADQSRLFTANGPSNDVSVIDTRTFHVIATLSAGGGPWGIALAPAVR
jgi:YVTN family beta-propeller protein